MEKEYSKDLIDVTPLAIDVYEMDNYIPDVPEQTTGSIAKKPRATKIVKSTMYHSEEFKERYEYFLQMRFEKKQKNTEFEQKMILEKLHKAGNENEALEMLTNAILGGHTNVVPINNGKNSSRTVKKEYAESTYDRLKRERDYSDPTDSDYSDYTGSKK